MEKGKNIFALNRSGYHLLIHDMPAWICGQCKEVYFEENAVDSIQEIIKKVESKCYGGL